MTYWRAASTFILFGTCASALRVHSGAAFLNSRVPLCKTPARHNDCYKEKLTAKGTVRSPCQDIWVKKKQDGVQKYFQCVDRTNSPGCKNPKTGAERGLFKKTTLTQCKVRYSLCVYPAPEYEGNKVYGVEGSDCSVHGMQGRVLERIDKPKSKGRGKFTGYFTSYQQWKRQAEEWCGKISKLPGYSICERAV